MKAFGTLRWKAIDIRCMELKGKRGKLQTIDDFQNDGCVSSRNQIWEKGGTFFVSQPAAESKRYNLWRTMGNAVFIRSQKRIDNYNLKGKSCKLAKEMLQKGRRYKSELACFQNGNSWNVKNSCCISYGQYWLPPVLKKFVHNNYLFCQEYSCLLGWSSDVATAVLIRRRTFMLLYWGEHKNIKVKQQIIWRWTVFSWRKSKIFRC